jgi:uncharacterized protein (TIGR02246 family)
MNLRISASIALAASLAALSTARPVAAQNDADTAAIRAADERLVKAFNAGKADELAALFHAKGELLDEQGVLHEGQAAIKGLLTKYFDAFPGAKMTVEVDSIRVVGPVAFEEGTRTITTKDETGKAIVHYSLVRTKVGNDWPIVSLREDADDPDITPHEHLESLAWLVGDWVNEGTDAVVRISYRWSTDTNFLLGDFHVSKNGSTVMQSTQRIGWDPLAGKVRSWMFDSDGGYGHGHWTQIEAAWVIKSTAVLPDGQTGSATITVTAQGKDRFVLKGTDRIVGDERDDDFEHVVTRRPPMPNK